MTPAEARKRHREQRLRKLRLLHAIVAPSMWPTLDEAHEALDGLNWEGAGALDSELQLANIPTTPGSPNEAHGTFEWSGLPPHRYDEDDRPPPGAVFTPDRPRIAERVELPPYDEDDDEDDDDDDDDGPPIASAERPASPRAYPSDPGVRDYILSHAELLDPAVLTAEKDITEVNLAQLASMVVYLAHCRGLCGCQPCIKDPAPRSEWACTKRPPYGVTNADMALLLHYAQVRLGSVGF